LLLLAACATAAPPAAPRDACVDYGNAMRAPLARLAMAADRFGDRIGSGTVLAARASRDMAQTLLEERGRMATVEPARTDLVHAHEHLIVALDDLGAAMRFLSEVLTARDEIRREPARARIAVAQREWRDAVREVEQICP
jgi:hypothetical protein